MTDLGGYGRPSHFPIIATTPCPTCGARIGENCTVVDGAGLEMRSSGVVCSARVEQYQP